MLQISQARHYMGKEVTITYLDRSGAETTKQTRIYDVAYVPSYGACLIADTDDIWLDRVTQIVES